MDVKVILKITVTYIASGNFQSNSEGSSAAMECSGVLALFRRSDIIRGRYLGDGDSNAFQKVNAENPYKDKPMEKLECIGRVQERVRFRLRRLKAKSKGVKLDDGKNLGGTGRLTDCQIDKLQTYYGLAIRRNVEDIQKMKIEILAAFYHKQSADDK